MKTTLLLITMFFLFASCGPSAEQKAAMEKAKIDSIVAAVKQVEKENAPDTTKYFELKLVGQDYLYDDYAAQLHFELKNLLTRQVQVLQLMASIKDKKGEFLAGQSFLSFRNVRSNGTTIGAAHWQGIKLNKIGEVLITMDIIEIEGSYLSKCTMDNINILDNKLGIKVSY